MPSLQLSAEQIRKFEQAFLQEVRQRTVQQVDSPRDAYVLYQQHNIQFRNLWSDVALACDLERERAYKFFRFTWSRQFHTSISEYKEKIKQCVIDYLDSLHLEQGVPNHLSRDLWHHVWNQFQHFGLHFDSTDQLTRNCFYQYMSSRGYELGKSATFRNKEELDPDYDPAQESGKGKHAKKPQMPRLSTTITQKQYEEILRATTLKLISSSKEVSKNDLKLENLVKILL